ncbi:MAG: YggS family pyridoxal phosphate-dependent enzyme [Lachnospiraceae bacterium]|nr:YggS family pyridoxal phosphate-dependent enzyme [Lachnospiraceae bacterium]
MIVNEPAVRAILEEVRPARLVAATKYVDADQLPLLEACGVTVFGENRVQAFLDKYEAYHGNAEWHFIGTLQTNKVKYIIDKVSLIHSVNSYALVDEIEKRAAAHGLVMDILLEVNIAHEASKQGFDDAQIEEMMAYLADKPHVHVRGLMMMAPLGEEARPWFHKTRELLDRLQKEWPQYDLTELSMGMSEDYPDALAEGSTMVRIGRALFQD